MFCARFFCRRGFAARYFPKVGLTPMFLAAWAIGANKTIGLMVEPE